MSFLFPRLLSAEWLPKLTTASALFLSTLPSLNAQEIAIWSVRGKAWSEWLNKECAHESTVLDAIGNAIPVNEFDRYRLVIIGLGSPARWTPEQHDAVRRYMKEGGVVLINSASIGKLVAAPGDVYDLSAGAEWIGGQRYSYGATDAKVMAPDHPAMSHLAGKTYDWYRSPVGISKLTTAKVLLGQKDNGRILVNRVGKGGLIYISPELTDTLKKHDEESGGPALSEVVRTLITGVLEEGESRDRILGKSVQWASARINGEERELELVAAEGETAATQLLASYLQRSLDRPVRIAGATPDPERLQIHIGNTPHVQELNLDLSTLHPHGYYLQTTGDKGAIVICGKNASALQYAVMDFLRRTIGYRFLGPGAEVIPTHEVLEVPENLNVRSEPSVLSYTNAGFWGANPSFSRSWRTTLKATHVLGDIVSPKKYAESRPELFPMYNGQRFIPPTDLGGTWQPCVSHPDLPELAMEWAREFFAKNPAALGIPLGVNDGGGDCQCPDCSAAREKYGNQYIPFYNRVAQLAKKEFPGKYVCFIAYGGARPAPRGIALEDNLLVEVTGGLAENHRQIKEWHEAGARNIGLYDYLYGAGFAVPRHYPHLMAREWREMYARYGLKSLWVESFIASWDYDGPKQYVLNELAWDMDADVDALLNEYFTLYYGPAAPAMSDLFARLEAAYLRSPDPLYPITGWKSWKQLEGYTFSDLAAIRKDLQRAMKLADGAIYRERVQRFSNLWELSESLIGASLHIAELTAMQGNASQWSQHVAAAREAMKKAVNYRLPEEQQKALFTRNGLTQFKGYEGFDMRPALEIAVDELFRRIDADFGSRGRGRQIAYWEAELKKCIDPYLQFLVSSHLAELNDDSEPKNLLASKAVVADSGEGESDWERADPRVPGWLVWRFPRSVTQFSVAANATPSGGYAMGIRRNDINGCYLRDHRVFAGKRYRLRLKVKQTVGSQSAEIRIRWKNEKGFYPAVNDEIIGPVSVRAPKANGEWQTVDFVFTVPPGVRNASFLLFGPPRQDDQYATWYGDIALTRIEIPAFFESATSKTR